MQNLNTLKTTPTHLLKIQRINVPEFKKNLTFSDRQEDGFEGEVGSRWDREH